MIRIEITIGRSGALPASADAVAADPAGAAHAAPLPAAGAQTAARRRGLPRPRFPVWQSLLASAVAALLFSLVATPNAPYAAVIAPVPMAASGASAPGCAVAALAVASANPPEARTVSAPAADGPLPLDIVATGTDVQTPATTPARTPTRPLALHDVALHEQTDDAPDDGATASAEPAAPPKPTEPSKPAAIATPVSFSIERSISSGEEALINTVTAMLAGGDWSGAHTALQASAWPASVPLAKLAARVALTGQAPRDAVAALAAVAANLDGEGRRLLAVALMQADRANDSADIYRGLLEVTPGDAELWMGLALALDAAGATREAVVYAYQQARDLSRDARVQRFAELRLAALA